jgi:hypothetical protein
LLSFRINYKITNYSKYLLILFEFESYIYLCNHFQNIKKLFKENLNLSKKDKYKLIGAVTASCQNHFAFYINKLNIDNIPIGLQKNTNYYYNDLEFNDRFQVVENIEKLFVNKDKLIIPYIAIYEKINNIV